MGSIFRTADGAGVLHIYLSGYTPRPLDKFKRPQKDIQKTALGAEEVVPWTYMSTAEEVIAKLRQDGWCIVGVEQDARAQDYRTLKIIQPTLFIFGTEVTGIDSELRDLCDDLIEIPMVGTKESLNVSVVAGIVLFATLRD